MNKFLTIAIMAAGLVFATAGQSEARDRGHHHHHHHHNSHSSHQRYAYRGDVHHHHYGGGYRREYRGYREPYYGYRPVYREPRYYGGGYCEPRRSVTVFIPGIGYVLRSY